MSSNLRAKPVEGYVTDSAGNVLRNSTILIKEAAPSGSNIIDTVQSDDNGYFISKPVPTGTYDIYESNIRVARNIHSASQYAVQCYSSLSANIPENLPSYTQMTYDSENDINKFRYYIQIEAENLDTKLYGYSYPIYESNLMVDELAYFSAFHELSAVSRLTSTRFDIEYFNPLTSTSGNYRRTRWTGVPAIRFFEDTKLVLPLDFYSILINRVNAIYDFSGNIDFTHNASIETISIYDASDSDADFTTLADSLTKGDILELTFDDLSDKKFYGIFVEEDTYNFHRRLILKKWRSSNYSSNPITGDLENMNYVTDVKQYDGMFNGLTNIGVSTNEKFTVVENNYAQNQSIELYDYSDT